MTIFKNRMFLIFCLIGGINTLIDLAIYVSLQAHGLPIVAANFISTCIALIVSFFLNRRFTFRSSTSAQRSILPFVLVTITGLWLLQPVIIYTVVGISNLATIKDLISPLITHYETVQNIVGKLFATPASLIWNFVLYRKFVFKQTDRVST